MCVSVRTHACTEFLTYTQVSFTVALSFPVSPSPDWNQPIRKSLTLDVVSITTHLQCGPSINP